jgi:hypothetical protein
MATSAATRLGLYTGFSLYPSTDEPRHIDLSTGRAFTRQVVSDDLSWLLGLNVVREGDSGMDLERVFRAHDQVLKRYNEGRGAAETSTLFTPGRSCIAHSILECNDQEAFQQEYEPRNTPQFNALQLSSTLSNSWQNFMIGFPMCATWRAPLDQKWDASAMVPDCTEAALASPSASKRTHSAPLRAPLGQKWDASGMVPALAENSCKRSQDKDASADALAWHPEWTATGHEKKTERSAKYQRLLRMSVLYQSLRDAVFVALEAQELKDQVERAKSLDIAIRHPLKCEKIVGPGTCFSPVFSDINTLASTSKLHECNNETQRHKHARHNYTH